MLALHWFITLGFSIFGIGCLILSVLGLPGTWLLIGAAALLEVFRAGSVGWEAIGFTVVLGIGGEVIETVASVAGLTAGGGTRRGMWGAVGGGLVGGILLTGLIPVPILGTLLGATLGAFGGAFAAEMTGAAAGAPESSVKAALGAAVGRLGGTFGKTLVGIAIWIILTVQMFLHS